MNFIECKTLTLTNNNKKLVHKFWYIDIILWNLNLRLIY